MTGLRTNERLLFEILNDVWAGQWVSEHKGIEGRRFRFDCANPALKIAIEIEGGIWLPKSGHTTGIGYEKNLEKYNLATVAGWRILRYSPQTLKARPYQIIRDLRIMCGESLNPTGQLNLTDIRLPSSASNVQVKL